jgi:hypothetical protein
MGGASNGSGQAGLGGLSGSGGQLSSAGSGGQLNSAGSGGQLNSAGSGGQLSSAGSGGASSLAPEWLAFAHADGMVAYDVTRLPGPDAEVLLGPAAVNNVQRPPLWSPDGQRLMYVAGTELYVRDMTTNPPGAPKLLASAISQSLAAWSGDGRSISLMFSLTTLTVLDPAQTAPVLRTLTTHWQGSWWAPAGNGLVYVDNGAYYFVRVQAGVPSQPQYVSPIGNLSWAPSGRYFTVTDGQVIKLFDTQPDTITWKSAGTTPPNTSATTKFSFDSARVAFTAVQARPVLDLAYSLTAAPTSSAILASTNLTGNVGVDNFLWHPSQSRLLYSTFGSPAGKGWFVVDVSGAAPKAPISVPGAQDAQWLADGASVITLDSTSKQLAVVDMTEATPTPKLFVAQSGQISRYAADPSATVLAFNTDLTLHLASIANPAQPATDVPIISSGSSNNLGWSWSPDGRFIRLTTANAQSNGAEISVARINGVAASTPIMLPIPALPFWDVVWQP